MDPANGSPETQPHQSNQSSAPDDIAAALSSRAEYWARKFEELANADVDPRDSVQEPGLPRQVEGGHEARQIRQQSQIPGSRIQEGQIQGSSNPRKRLWGLLEGEAQAAQLVQGRLNQGQWLDQEQQFNQAGNSLLRPNSNRDSNKKQKLGKPNTVNATLRENQNIKEEPREQPIIIPRALREPPRYPPRALKDLPFEASSRPYYDIERPSRQKQKVKRVQQAQNYSSAGYIEGVTRVSKTSNTLFQELLHQEQLHKKQQTQRDSSPGKDSTRPRTLSAREDT